MSFLEMYTFVQFRAQVYELWTPTKFYAVMCSPSLGIQSQEASAMEFSLLHWCGLKH